MAQTHALNIRLSPLQYKILQKAAEKLGISKTDVIRFALARLAEAENLLPKPK